MRCAWRCSRAAARPPVHQRGDARSSLQAHDATRPAGTIEPGCGRHSPDIQPEVSCHGPVGSLVLRPSPEGSGRLAAGPGYRRGHSAAAGSSFNSNLSLPGTDSQAAATLLTQNFPAASGEGDQVVIQAAHGTTIQSTPVQAAVTAALARVARVPGVETVASPYAQTGRRRSAGPAPSPSRA